jgi:acyl-[acyl-carrier-protein]-phospholipid O-acyltransferase/long-chain-fatty-acid--[acyl-carrier-protein] ligase
MIKELTAAGLPNLWIPGSDSFYEVEQIPVLGTGKLDLQAVKELAKVKVGSSSGSRQASPS